MPDDDRRLVYSTDGTLPLPEAPKRKAAPHKPPGLPDDGIVRVARERRRASAVTLVHGLRPAEIDDVGKTLRRLCGTGGTTKNGIVELQGDHREAVVAYFERENRRVKSPAAESVPARSGRNSPPQRSLVFGTFPRFWS